MEKEQKMRLLLDGCFILAGSSMVAFAINYILVPNGLATSGIAGVALILSKLSGINYAFIYYGFSLFILLSAYKIMGRRETAKIVVVSILFPTLLVAVSMVPSAFIQGDPMLACIYFSIFYGTGIGMVLRRGYSYGGTDTIAQLLRKTVFPHYNVSQILLVLDGAIILSSAFVFGKTVALYSLINHVLTMAVFNYVMFGWGTKLYKINILSPDTELIRQYIMEMGRGVTLHRVVGGYTGEERVQIASIVSPSQANRIRRYVAEHSPSSFVDIAPVITVYSTAGARFHNLQDKEP